MKTQKITLAVLVLIISVSQFLLTSCSKKIGCTDPSSENYCSDCEKDDGSCQYNAKVHYWWKKSFRDSCLSHGVLFFVAYWDGQMQGTAGGTTNLPGYWNNEPGCYDDNLASVQVKDLGSNKSGTISLSFKMYDLHDSLILEKSAIPFEVHGNGFSSCNMCEIKW